MTAPRMVMHYAIEGRIGAGGMGVVYRAVDTRLDRVVALKFLPDVDATDAAARARLLGEARAAARLDHPHIGVVYGIEGLDDEPFIVMALYEGQTLAGALRAGPLAVEDATEYARQVALGLDAAHAAGVVHRDVKPANLMLTPGGVVKILDFGLARRDALDGPTRTGDVIGTPAYLAPEQARGHRVDHRVDLWSLGAVLYEMLTGAPPFAADGGFAATLLRVLRDDPAPPSSLRPDVSVALDAVVARALAKDPDLRYASAREVLDDLTAILATGDAASRRRPSGGSMPTAVPAAPAPEPGTTVDRPVASALPTPAAPLVGRDDEVAIATLHLSDPHCRVLTLFGPGGTGKTRLALALAHGLQRDARFPDGVVFAPLEALDHDAQVPGAIATALDLTLEGDGDVLGQVIRRVGTASMLLVLDNFEHVIAGAEVASALVAACPRLTLLVTSRERLNLEEEWVLPVGGLPAPPPAGPVERERVLGYAAVRLFLQRAARADVRFTASDDDLHHVGTICRLVQGSPLGLELAAAWVKMIPCSEIASEIGASLDFLERGGRGGSARHRSLRATFAYSWGLLDPSQRAALRALAVFHGGFTRQAARDVVGADLRLLAALVDKSLLDTLPSGRYDFHPLVHQYAREQLAEAPDEAAKAHEAHALHFHGLLASRLEALRGHGHAAAYQELEADLPNVRAAWRWASEARRLDLLVGSAKPLDLVLDNKGRHLEAGALFGEAVARLDPADPTHLEALAVLGTRQAWAAYAVGRLTEARPLAARSLAWSRSTAGGTNLVAALNTLAAIELAAGAFGPAKELWREAVELARAAGGRRDLATALGNLASAEWKLGEREPSRAHQREVLALAREGDDPTGVVVALVNLASSLVAGDRAGEARGHLEEALVLARTIGFDVALPILLHNLGSVHHALHAYAEAVPLYREALGMARERGDRTREAHALASLGLVHVALGDLDPARAFLADGLRVAWANQELPTALRCIGGLAAWHAEQGRLADAIAWLTTVHEHPASDPADVAATAALLTRCLTTVPADEAAEAQARGRSLGLDEAVAQALAS
jgi:predicted ATPase